MSNTPPIKDMFAAPAKKEWQPVLKANQLELAITNAKNAMEERHQQELQEHEANKPDVNDDVSRQLSHQEETENIIERHRQEFREFISECDELRGAHAGLSQRFAEYGTAHSSAVKKLDEAWKSIEPQLAGLVTQRQDVERRRNELLNKRKVVTDKLQGLGVTRVTPGLSIQGWERPLRDNLLREACQRRDISPDSRPTARTAPTPPAPIEPMTPRTIDDPLSPVDLLMSFGGAILGSSFAATAGIFKATTEGFRPTPLFWGVVLIGVVLAFFCGKLLYPSLIGTIRLDTIDAYPYLSDEDGERARQMKMKKREAVLAKITMIGFLLFFIVTDYIGWFRAAKELNEANSGIRGIFQADPRLSGLGAAFFSSAFAVVKWYSVNKVASRQVQRLEHEILANTSIYNTQMAAYQREMEAFEGTEAEVREFERQLGLAKQVVDHRMATDQKVVAVVAAVEEFNEEVAKFEESTHGLATPESVAREALQHLNGYARPLNMLEVQLTRDHGRVKDFIEFHLGPIT